jgi:hypothetical protein
MPSQLAGRFRHGIEEACDRAADHVDFGLRNVPDSDERLAPDLFERP